MTGSTTQSTELKPRDVADGDNAFSLDELFEVDEDQTFEMLYVEPEIDLRQFDPSLRLEELWRTIGMVEPNKFFGVCYDPHVRDSIQVLHPKVVAALNAGTRKALMPDKGDGYERMRAILSRLADRNALPWQAGWRRAVRANAAHDGALVELGERFPNFARVVDFVRDRLALALCGTGWLRLPPLLLTGPAGVGKTEFARRFAALFDTPLVHVDMASAQSNFALAGSEEYWANSRPGYVFDAIIEGEHASPVILLDEIDKTSSTHHDPLGPLYRLLEPASAASFCDASAPKIQFDASHVLWIATANSAESIAQPLLTRFAIFEIDRPDREQMIAIGHQIYAGIVAQMNGAPALDEDVLEALAGLSVRALGRALESGLAKAIRAKSARFRVEHLKRSEPARRARIGF